jgi:AcrR family transcriptional regulator
MRSENVSKEAPLGRTAAPQEIKQRLILTALHLFSEQGIAAVSLRTVNRAVGQKNTSAAHYHFGDKTGLVDAVISFIQDWFTAQREAPLTAIEEAAKAGPILTEDVLRVWALPYIELMKTEEWGYAAIRLIAHLQFEQESTGREAHSRVATDALRRLNTLMEQSIPDVPPMLTRHRFALCVNSIVQNLANAGARLDSDRNVNSKQLDSLLELYLEVNSAGLKAPTTIKKGSATYKRLGAIPSLL